MELTKVRRVLDLGAGAGALTWAVAEARKRQGDGSVKHDMKCI